MIWFKCYCINCKKEARTENKHLSLNKIEKEKAKVCSHCNTVVCFIPKLQQIMGFY